MNTVTTINLAGMAFQLEDPAYVILKRYLDDAKSALSGNPDAGEIFADIERAIAEKCRRFIGTNKNVVTEDEARTIVNEMGPVSGSTTEPVGDPTQPVKPKRLYRVIEGEWLGGVANGIAAYFDIDVTLARLGIVALTIITGGGFALVYFAAWMIIPPAVTGEQRAAASGDPFNAQEIVDRVKTEYARFEAKHSVEWKKQWKDWKRELKQKHKEHKEWERRERMRYAYEYYHRPSAFGELLGIVVFCFLVWLGYHHVLIVREFLDAVWDVFTNTVNTITTALTNR